MGVGVKKPQKEKLATSTVAQKRANPAAAQPFVDNRPASVEQHNLHDSINNSPQVQQLRTIQRMVDSSSAAGPVIQLQKYRWTAGRTNVVKVSDNAYKNLSGAQKATEADYFRVNPQMVAEMAPITSRTYETVGDAAANAAAGPGAARQRSGSIHVPTRNRSGSVDIRHTHDNINSAAPAVDQSVGHIDRNGVRTGRAASGGSRTGAAPVTRPEAGELAEEDQ